MSKKQTAVNWLIEQLVMEYCLVDNDLFEQARLMDKEQSIQIAKDNCEELGDDEAEEYYNNKFN